MPPRYKAEDLLRAGYSREEVDKAVANGVASDFSTGTSEGGSGPAAAPVPGEDRVKNPVANPSVAASGSAYVSKDEAPPPEPFKDKYTSAQKLGAGGIGLVVHGLTGGLVDRNDVSDYVLGTVGESNPFYDAKTVGSSVKTYGDKEPTKEDGTNDSGVVTDAGGGAASAAGVHNRPMGGGGGGGGPSPYDKAMGAYKTNLQNKFEQYVQTPSDELRHAEEEKGNIAERQGNEAGDLMARQRAQSEELFKQQQAEEAARNAELEDRLAKLQQANDEVSNMNVSVKNFWSSRSAAQNAIGIFASALSVAAHGPSLIDKAISQDLELQKENIDNKRKGLDYSKSIYNAYYQITQDKRVAALAAKIHLEESAKSELTEMAARHGGEREKANAASHVAQIDQNIGENRMKLEAILNPPPARPTGGVGGGAPHSIPAQNFGTVVTLNDGSQVQVNSEKEAEDLRGRTAAVRDFRIQLEEMKKIEKENPVAVHIAGTDANRSWKAANAKVLLSAKAATQGMNSKEDLGIVRESTGVPSHPAFSGVETLEKTINTVERQYKQNLPQGMAVVRTVTVNDPKTGAPTKVLVQTGQTYAPPVPPSTGKK